MTDAAAELARLVEEVSGNVVPAPHHRFLQRTAEQRLRATGQRSFAAYVDALARGALPGEWSSLLPLVTISESYLFRTPQHFAALTATILPRLLASRAGERRVRVWSAGCARGEEPATLAIVLADTPALAGWDWRIVATDVDEAALAAARRGAYRGRAVTGVPAPLLRRYFSAVGEDLALSPALLSRIDYRTLNLVREPFAAPGGQFDVIFLRNVLIYFRPESQRRVVAALAGTLSPDGYLFVGPAETLWQISDELEPLDLGDCFCYQRKSPRPPSSPATGREARRARTAPRAHDQPGPRVSRSQTSAACGLPTTAPLPAPAAAAGDEPRAAGHRAMPGTQDRLAEAVRHLLADRIPDAVALVDQALAADPADAEAHALEGLVHHLRGDTEMAIASLRAALYLDPALFQAQLLLADALRRLGWRERAETAYRTVLNQLALGAARDLASLASLPLPDRAAAAQRARAALLSP
jgi:chemotaxis protein methyltransferase CheR